MFFSMSRILEMSNDKFGLSLYSKKEKGKSTSFSIWICKLSIIHIKAKRHLSALWISLTLLHLESSYTAIEENYLQIWYSTDQKKDFKLATCESLFCEFLAIPFDHITSLFLIFVIKH